MYRYIAEADLGRSTWTCFDRHHAAYRGATSLHVNEAEHTGRDRRATTWPIVGRLLGAACVQASPTLRYRSTSSSW